MTENIEHLTTDDIELMVAVLEDVLESRVTVKQIMQRHGISYDTYTTISDLAMPFIRNKHKGERE